MGIGQSIPVCFGSDPPFADNMKTISVCSALFLIGVAALGAPAQKPRVFITESAAPQVSGDAAVGDVKGSLAFTGGTSPENVEVMKAFVPYCPAAIVTADRVPGSGSRTAATVTDSPAQ